MALHKTAVGLTFAAPCQRPNFIPKSRPKGVKAEGLRYERLVGKEFPKALVAQWWNYIDANGPGWCQTDLVLRSAKRALVLECKLTDTDYAVGQLKLLYLPVVELALGVPAYGIVVAKYLTPATERSRVVDNLDAAIALAELGAVPILHWLGKSPLYHTK